MFSLCMASTKESYAFIIIESIQKRCITNNSIQMSGNTQRNIFVFYKNFAETTNMCNLTLSST